MKTTNSLFLALTLIVGAAATGCATDASDPGTDDPGTNPGGGDGGSDDAPHATNLAGKYTMRSTYDLATNMPGKIGAAANMFIAATDDPDDPTNWLLEQMINAMPNGTVKTFLNNARGYVSGYLNDQLLGWAPDFVSTMVTVGADFGDMTKHFGMNETLTVTGANDALMSSHTVTGMHFKFGNQESDFAFADYGVADVKVDNVGLTFDATGRLTVAQHQVPLKFGQVLRIGLDNGIIPLVDANATDLNTLFADKIDCYAVGGYVADAVGIGSASTYESACIAGINAGANALYAQIAGIDSDALNFGIAGTARAVDSNNDGNADKIQTGVWTGNLSYAGTPAPLSTATFHAERQ
jgi:hypothetical protein